VRTLLDNKLSPAGTYSVTWNGRDHRNRLVADGTYTVTYDAIDLVSLNAIQKKTTITIERNVPVISKHSATPDSFKKGTLTNIIIKYTLSENAKVTLKIKSTDSSKDIRILLNNVVRSAGDHFILWNGKNASGTALPAGSYKYSIVATDSAGKTSMEANGTISVTN
jgi:flagellar hook assembly protein FlgD